MLKIRFNPSRLTNYEIRAHRLRIFSNERQTQLKRIRRVEKIEVNVIDPIQSTKLLMNKSISTPYHCAQHLSSVLVDRSCLALIDDEQVWDMNRPLEHDCQLKFLHFMNDRCEEHVHLFLVIFLKHLSNRIIMLNFVHLLTMFNSILLIFIDIPQKINTFLFRLKEIGNLVVMIFVIYQFKRINYAIVIFILND